MVPTELRDTDSYADADIAGEPIASDDCSVSAAELDEPWADQEHVERALGEQWSSNEPVLTDSDSHCDPFDLDDLQSHVVGVLPGDYTYDDNVDDHGEPVADCSSIDEEDSA